MLRILVIFIVIIINSLAFASEPILPLKEYNTDNITLEADEIFAPDSQTYEATGNVVIIKDNATLSADKVVYNKETGVFDASGNVRLREGGNFFDCSRLMYNFVSEQGTFLDVKGFVEPYHYIEAEKLERTAYESFLIEKGRFTTCPGDIPDWSFRAKKATMDIGHYIKSTNTTGWIKSVPVLYTPYLVYPIKTERESGFLVPKLGSNSTRGSMIGIKYYQDINLDKDATIGTNIFSSGIVQTLGEFRYNKSSTESVYIYGEYMFDKKSESDTKKRYLFYQDSNFKVGDNTELYIEVDYVSDYRYLRDIADTEMIPHYDNPDNRFYADARLVHRTDSVDFGIRTKRDMQFADIENGYKKTEITRLPNLFARKNLKFGLLGLNYTLDLDHVVYKEETIYPADTSQNTVVRDEYQRAHFTTEFYTPIDIKVATFKPFAKIYATTWENIKDAKNVRNSKKNTFAQVNARGDHIDRLTYSIGYEIALNEITKDYDSFVHTIYNIFRYEQVPNLDHAQIPERIEGDFIEGTKSYTYLFKNYFNAEKWNLDASLEQSYDMIMSKNRLRPLVAKADFNYDDKLKAYLRHDYDHSNATTSMLNQRLSITTDRFTFSEEYLYEDKFFTDEVENTSLEFSVSASLKNLELAFKTQTSGLNSSVSLNNLNTISNTIYAKYKAGCWDIGLSLIQKEYNPIDDKGSYSGKEQIIYLVIGLQGLGSFRSPVSSNRSSDRVDSFY